MNSPAERSVAQGPSFCVRLDFLKFSKKTLKYVKTPRSDTYVDDIEASKDIFELIDTKNSDQEALELFAD